MLTQMKTKKKETGEGSWEKQKNRGRFMKFDFIFINIEVMEIFFKILGLLVLAAINVSSLKFGVYVDRSKGPVCFYESLKMSEKYLFKVYSDASNFRMDVMRTKQGGQGWQTIVSKNSNNAIESINKLAQTEGTYAFCVSTTDEKAFKAQMQIESGLEQTNLDYLPSLTDHQMLDRQIEWMEKQKKAIFEAIRKNDDQRTAGETLKSMMGVTMIMMALLGLVIVGAVNVAFYMLAKKTLKDRKLI